MPQNCEDTTPKIPYTLRDETREVIGKDHSGKH